MSRQYAGTVSFRLLLLSTVIGSPRILHAKFFFFNLFSGDLEDCAIWQEFSVLFLISISTRKKNISVRVTKWKPDEKLADEHNTSPYCGQKHFSEHLAALKLDRDS